MKQQLENNVQNKPPKQRRTRRPSGDGMVRKRKDGTWEGRIVVGHKADKKPIYRSVFAKTQKQLIEKLHNNIQLYQGVELNENSQMTLAQWLEKWLNEYAKNRVRASTFSSYTQYVKHYITPYLGNKNISSITIADVQRLYQKLKKEGRITKHPEKGYELSNSTVKSVHSMLHQAMHVAVEQHLIPKNPTVGTTVPKATHQEMQVLTREQVDTFLAEIEKDAYWHDFFYTELTTGLRLGEICGLQWCDFNEEDGTISVNRTLHYQSIGVYSTGDTKTGKGKRKIILPASTATILKNIKAITRSNWIFHNRINPEYPLSTNLAYSQLKKFLKTAMLPNIRFHDLRHTFGNIALSSGVDPKTLSMILGHTNASFTLDTYTHVTGDMQRQAAAVVEEFITDIFGDEILYA